MIFQTQKNIILISTGQNVTLCPVCRVYFNDGYTHYFLLLCRHESKKKKKEKKSKKEKKKKEKKKKRQRRDSSSLDSDDNRKRLVHLKCSPVAWDLTNNKHHKIYKLFLSFICIFLLNTSISRSHLIITGFSKFASFYENILKMVPPLVFWTIWRISGWLWNTIFPLSPLEGTKALSYTQHLGSISYIWGSCLTRPQIHPEKQVYRRVGDIPDE